MRHLLLTCLALALPGLARAEEAAAWDPSRTHVLVASIIEWPDAGLAPFKDPRRDEGLVAQFRAAGVPAGQIVFLKDREATLAAIRRELKAVAARAGEGSTLIFYFQGHGLRHKERTWLACYDVKVGDPATAFEVAEIFPILDGGWKGERLVLIGDCCHSGALGAVVDRFDGHPRVRAAAFTSATASNTSTVRWTFTEALITALAGDGRVDGDRDGVITFGEVDAFVRSEMKYREGQLTRARLSERFGEAFILRRVAADRPAPARVAGGRQVGDFLEAMDREGKWYVAEVLAVDGEKVRVHYLGWDAKWDEWVTAEKLRPIVRAKHAVGTLCEVEWKKDRWFLARIMKAEGDWFYYVHYEGEEGDDDEWVMADRIRPAPAGKKPVPPEFVARAPRASGKGDAPRPDRAPSAQNTSTLSASAVAAASSSMLLRRAPAITSIRVGDRVLACWGGKTRMYPAVVEGKTAGGCRVKWEDGTPATEVPFGQIARIR